VLVDLHGSLACVSLWAPLSVCLSGCLPVCLSLSVSLSALSFCLSLPLSLSVSLLFSFSLFLFLSLSFFLCLCLCLCLCLSLSLYQLCLRVCLSMSVSVPESVFMCVGVMCRCEDHHGPVMLGWLEGVKSVVKGAIPSPQKGASTCKQYSTRGQLLNVRQVYTSQFRTGKPRSEQH